MEGGDVAPGDLARGDLVEQGLREGGPRDQRLEGGGSLRRMERPVVRGQQTADGRVVGEGEAAKRDRIQEPDADQSLADRPEVGRPAVDQGLEGELARLEIELVIEREPLHLVEGPAVAEEDVEVPQPGRDGRIGARREPGAEGFPALGLAGLVPARQGLGQAGQHARFEARRGLVPSTRARR